VEAVSIHEDLLTTIVTEIGTQYDTRVGRDVPTTTKVGLKEAVKVDATYLYADLADSSTLAQSVPPEDAARVIRAYVNVVVRLIRYNEGHIRSFDGDRVMGIYMGPDKETRAGRTALAAEAYVRMMREWIPDEVPSVNEADWSMRHGIGIDTGEALIVRGGIRNNSDLISIGQAPNVAAKLSDLRDGKSIHATYEAYAPMSWGVSYTRTSNSPRCMWEYEENITVGGRTINVLSSQYGWVYEKGE